MSLYSKPSDDNLDVSNAVGIDFGTSNCRVAVNKDGRMKICTDDAGNFEIPSIVAFDSNFVFVGEEAEEVALKKPMNAVYNVKRFLGRCSSDAKTEEKGLKKTINNSFDGSDFNLMIDGKLRKYSPEQVAAFLLSYLKRLAEGELGMPVVEAIATIPAGFDTLQRAALLDAGKIAGLKLNLVSSCVSAALELQPSVSGYIFAADWGGGYFETAVIRSSSTSVEVVSASSWPYGGTDLDEDLVRHMLAEFDQNSKTQTVLDDVERLRLRMSCEKVRNMLSSTCRANMENASCSDQELNAVVTRDDLNDVFQDVYQEIEKRIRDELLRAGITTDDVSEILLLGRASNTNHFRKIVSNVFHGRHPVVNVNRFQSVVCGAVKRPLTDICVMEVLPMPLGIEGLNQLVQPLFQRNCHLPTSVYRTFSTQSDDQSEMIVHIFSGSSMMVKNCSLLCKISVSGIPKGPAGKTKVKLYFKINKNGILAVKNATRQGRVAVDFIKNRLLDIDIFEITEHVNRLLAATKEHQEHVRVKNEIENICNTINGLLEYEKYSFISMDSKPKIRKSIGSALHLLQEDMSTTQLSERLDLLKWDCKTLLGDL